MRCLIVLVLLGAVFSENEKVFKVTGTDSYLEAYKELHGGDSVNDLLDNAIKKVDREYIEPGGYPYPNPQGQYGPPFDSSGPSAPNYNYGPPRPQYGPPNSGPAYGLQNPSPSYGPPNPRPVYGSPNPEYSPPVVPNLAPVYGAPSSVQVFYGMPHAMLSIWDKLKFKLNLFVIGKILLKLVIFKKIVSLIAILCLLLFIPSLKHKEESSEVNDGMMRAMRDLNNDNTMSGEESLNNISTYVLEAIDNFSKKEKKPACNNNILCKTQEILKRINKKMSYKKLAKLYSQELNS